MGAPEIRFFNSLGRRLETFEPLQPGKARIYTCGPTVYAAAHIGNFRTFVFEDLLCRGLRYLGLEVVQVMNLTDVEDKIIRGMAASGQTLDDFVAPHIDAFFRDLDRLRVRRAEHYPRATTHIEEMQEIITRLLDRGNAYEAEGSVFFRIDSDADYGKLSGIDPEQMRRGTRVASDEYDKEDVRDFVLWKGSKADEPSWPSPWGPGRPGWHIECSAMSMKYLGESFDIHCGGVDNAFPHHENEIAQSESATGRPFSRFWLHAEHLLVDGQKMAKSLGNQYTLDDLLERQVDLRALRYLFLSVHYRQKLNFTFESLESAARALQRVDEMRFRLANAKTGADPGEAAEACSLLRHEFAAALADDLNASQALAAVHGFVRRVNVLIEEQLLDEAGRVAIEAELAAVDEVLGVLEADVWATEGSAADGLSDAEIDELVAARGRARAERDWSEADRIRDQLAAAGVVLEDTRDGVRWKRG